MRRFIRPEACVDCERPFASGARARPSGYVEHRAQGRCDACARRFARNGAPSTPRKVYIQGGRALPFSAVWRLDEWEFFRDQGFSLQEVAAKLDVQVKTLEQQLYRARRKGDKRGALEPYARDMNRRTA